MFKLPVIAALSATLIAGPAFAGQHYTVVAGDPANGATIKIPNGDKLLLKLTACESCGYRWKLTQKPNSSVIVFDQQLKSISQCTAPCTGGNATERFQFSSKSVGKTSVKFGYFGPGKSKPSKTKSLTLSVTA